MIGALSFPNGQLEIFALKLFGNRNMVGRPAPIGFLMSALILSKAIETLHFNNNVC